MSRLAGEDEMLRIHREASAWVVLGDERPWTTKEEGAFAEWIAADPRHEPSYRAMLETWDDVPAAASWVEAAGDDRSNVIAFTPRVEMERDEAPRRRWLLPSLAAIAAAAAMILAFLTFPRGGGDQIVPLYRTALAEQRVVQLADGSVVTLGPQTTLVERFEAGARRVKLAGGEAFFEVAHDKARPFLVEAGNSLIRVVGTKFDVNLGKASIRVAVLEGIVQVGKTGASTQGDGVRTLRRGQRVEIAFVPAADGTTTASAAASENAEAPIVTQAAQPAGAWREGRLSFDNVRLADLVADVNRYYGPGVSLDDPALGELRVTAFFAPGEIRAFLSALPGIVPVSTAQLADGSVRIAKAEKAGDHRF